MAFFREAFFYFGDNVQVRKKLWHFPRLFWSSQNRKCVIFELAPGPRLTLGAPGRSQGRGDRGPAPLIEIPPLIKKMTAKPIAYSISVSFRIFAYTSN